MRRAAAFVAVAALVALGACTDDDGEVATATSTPSTPTTSVSPVTTSTSAAPTTTAAAGLSSSSAVGLRGIGPVQVGMTLAEASTAAGRPVVAGAGSSDECGFAAPEGGPEGVRFLTTNGRIARVDVESGPVRTRSGAGVGDTEADVQAKYSGQLEVSPHKYVPAGHYLTLVPTDPADAEYRLIFETDGTRVTRYRAGRQPEVSYVEGCS